MTYLNSTYYHCLKPYNNQLSPNTLIHIHSNHTLNRSYNLQHIKHCTKCNSNFNNSTPNTFSTQPTNIDIMHQSYDIPTFIKKLTLNLTLIILLTHVLTPNKMAAAAILNCGYFVFRRHRCVLNQCSNIPTKCDGNWSNSKEMATIFRN